MNVLALQYDIAWEDRDANLSKVRRLLSASAPGPGALIVLPEMALTGFSMNPDKVADTEARECETALRQLALEHRSWVLGGVVSRAPDGRGRNEALLATPEGGVGARYTKIHPFSLTREHVHYEAGADVVVAPCGPFRLAPFVCYDLRFPEVFRTAARRGATLLVVIANWPEARHAHWRALLQARAIENQAWVVGVNRCGRDPKFVYAGGSLVIDPSGRVEAEAGAEEEVLRGVIDLQKSEELRASLPFLGDIRQEWTRP